MGHDATSRRSGSRLEPWPSSTPTRRRPCVACEPPFGFVEVLEVVDHEADQDQDEAVEE